LYTNSDFQIMLVRGILLPLICILWQGWLLGSLSVVALNLGYYQVLKVWYKMERLAALDEFFLLDNDKNRANIITVVKTDKIPDYERMRTLTI
jgi:hypothetical protein